MIERDDIESIKDLFISRKEFTEFCTALQAESSRQNERLAAIETQVKIIMWLVGAVVVAVIPILLSTFK